jgi:hypothetical protein
VRVTNFEIVAQSDHCDVTSFGDSRRTYVTGLPTYTVNVSGVLEDFTVGVQEHTYGWPKVTPATPKQTTTTAMRSEMQIWEYAAYYEGRVDEANSHILIEPTTMLANNSTTVERVATRAVVDDGTLNWDWVRINVVPFDVRF